MATVAFVSASAVHGFSKEVVPEIGLIAGEGVEGDAHRGRTTQHLYRMRKDPTQPNLSQVHLLAAEKLEELAGKGHTVQPGELGENVLTHGLDLLELPKGTRLTLGADAVVELTGLRTPCSKIDGLQPGLQQHMWGERGADNQRTRRAGIMGIVVNGGTVRAGDSIRVQLPPEPYLPLPPV